MTLQPLLPARGLLHALQFGDWTFVVFGVVHQGLFSFLHQRLREPRVVDDVIDRLCDTFGESSFRGACATC